MHESFDEHCKQLREKLRQIGPEVKAMMNHHDFGEPRPGSDTGEMKANIMLSYRHVEDAIMRLGKAIQAYDGGTSVYPR